MDMLLHSDHPSKLYPTITITQTVKQELWHPKIGQSVQGNIVSKPKWSHHESWTSFDILSNIGKTLAGMTEQYLADDSCLLEAEGKPQQIEYVLPDRSMLLGISKHCFFSPTQDGSYDGGHYFGWESSKWFVGFKGSCWLGSLPGFGFRAHCAIHRLENYFLEKSSLQNKILKRKNTYYR